MGNEIFLKFFDGPQKIFPIFNFYYIHLKTYVRNVQSNHQEDLRKIRHVKLEIKSFELNDKKW